jgi:hypothetical protein
VGRLRSLVDALLCELARFEPGEHSGADCAVLVTSLAQVEKAAAGARCRAAARAAECGAHRDLGFADASEWLAREAGTTARSARADLDTVRALAACPDTREAVAMGAVSLVQAGEIARTVVDVPESEAELLRVAQSSGLSKLRDTARARRLAAISAEELHAKQRSVRELRHWRDDIGMVCGTFRLTPAIGVPFVNRLERKAQRLRRAARQNGETAERFAAYLADAFVDLLDTSAQASDSTSKATRRDVDAVIVCDLNAYRRGQAHEGEVCHIVGGGPIPVELARELSKDAFLKVVLHDGVEIRTVKHFGRRIPAELRTALELGGLPALDGVTCTEEECERRYGLEWDHVDPIANGGVTSVDNLKPRCSPHHWDKTERDRKAGRLGGRRTRARPPP